MRTCLSPTGLACRAAAIGLALALQAAAASELIPIPGGTFTMGDPSGEPDEALRQVTVLSFRMMRHEITNREFAAFVAATGHRTDAERSGFGYVWTERWRRARGANWRHPQGRGSAIAGLDDHPVVQVSARDAAAYCAWRGLGVDFEPVHAARQ